MNIVIWMLRNYLFCYSYTLDDYYLLLLFVGQCCRLHVVGQRIVNDNSVVRSCICSLCSESNNTTLLLRLHIAVLVTYILLHIPNTH